MELLFFWPDCAALVVHASFGYYFLPRFICRFVCAAFGLLGQGVLINSWSQIAYINADIFIAIIVRCLAILIYRLWAFD